MGANEEHVEVEGGAEDEGAEAGNYSRSCKYMTDHRSL